LKDTLILHELPAWRKSRKRKPLGASKYYFFDVGVVAALQGREFRPGTPEFGEAFETTLFHDLIGYRDYVSRDPLCYWRSTSGSTTPRMPPLCCLFSQPSLRAAVASSSRSMMGAASSGPMLW